MSSSGQTTISPSNLQRIIDASSDYAHRMGIDFSQSPFAKDLEGANSPNDILKLLQEREKAFIRFREGNRTIVDSFSLAVAVLHAFSEILGETISLVSCTTSIMFVPMLRVYSTSPGFFPSSKGYLRRN